MKKLFVFAVAFIAFTGYSFSGQNKKIDKKATDAVANTLNEKSIAGAYNPILK